MISYMTITDGGDGDISWGLYDTEAEAQEDITESREYGSGYFALIEVDWEAKKMKRTMFCQ